MNPLSRENVEKLLDNLFSAWNESDSARQDHLLRAICTPALIYRDPHSPGDVDGLDAFLAFLRVFHERVPYQLEPLGEPDTFRQVFRRAWRFCQPQTERELSRGQFFGTLDEQGLLLTLTSFVDQPPA